MKNIFRRNISLKIISIFFAFLLWNYVIGETNPLREKTISNIPVKFINENVLEEKELIPKEDLKLKDLKVKVRIEARLKDFDFINASNVEAIVDLSQVDSTGKMPLKIEATVPDLGKVKSVSPQTVDLEIDHLVSRSIPVQPQFTDNLSSGYWHGEVEVTPNVINVTGAKSDVDKIRKALVWVSLKGVIAPIQNVYPLLLVGEDSQEVVGNFESSAASAIIRMPVYPTKWVDVEMSNAIVGANKLPKDYEVKSTVIKPAKVLIAAEQSILDKTNSIRVESVDVKGAKTNVIKTVKLIPDKGVELPDVQEVEVIVNIGEIEDEKKITVPTIALRNMKENRKAVLSVSEAQVRVKAVRSILHQLTAENIILYVDAAGLDKGTYELPIQWSAPDGVEVLSVDPVKIAVTIG